MSGTDKTIWVVSQEDPTAEDMRSLKLFVDHFGASDDIDIKTGKMRVIVKHEDESLMESSKNGTGMSGSQKKVPKVKSLMEIRARDFDNRGKQKKNKRNQVHEPAGHGPSQKVIDEVDQELAKELNAKSEGGGAENRRRQQYFISERAGTSAMGTMPRMRRVQGC